MGDIWPLGQDTTTGRVRIMQAGDIAVNNGSVPVGNTGKTYVQITVVGSDNSLAVENGKHYFRINSRLAGTTLESIGGSLITAGSGSGTTTVQITRLRGDAEKTSGSGTSVMSTPLTFATTAFEGGSAVISTGGVLEGDLYRFDILAVTSGAGSGLIVDLVFS